ncbi:MAG: hypothetical protein J1F22_02425 [Lachnospiraceae bacterium]|nr:hypothetical protein [Lachnospiraceae bacterium]
MEHGKEKAEHETKNTIHTYDFLHVYDHTAAGVVTVSAAEESGTPYEGQTEQGIYTISDEMQQMQTAIWYMYSTAARSLRGRRQRPSKNLPPRK